MGSEASLICSMSVQLHSNVHIGTALFCGIWMFLVVLCNFMLGSFPNVDMCRKDRSILFIASKAGRWQCSCHIHTYYDSREPAESYCRAGPMCWEFVKIYKVPVCVSMVAFGMGIWIVMWFVCMPVTECTAYRPTEQTKTNSYFVQHSPTCLF